MNPTKHQRLLIHPAFATGVLVLGIALRAGWVFALRSTPIHDGWWYHLRGAGMAAGQGYSIDGWPTAFWPVGYPAFLGLIYKIFSPAPLAAQLANVALAAAALILTRSLALRLTRSVAAANLALALLAFHPNGIAYCSLHASEPLFSALLLGAAWILVRSLERGGKPVPHAMAAGLLFGLTCTVKPQALFVPLIVMILYPGARAQMRSRAVQASILYACCALTVLPWAVRNGRLSGRFIPFSTNGGFNLFVGNNPFATGSYTFSEPMRKLLGVEKEYSSRGIAEEDDLDRRAGALARQWVRQNPGAALALAPRKLSALYKGDVDGFYYQGTAEHQSYQETGRIQGAYRVLVILSQLYYMGMLGLFALALVTRSCWHEAGPALRLGLGIVVYFTAVYLVFFGIMRFHYPLMPWIAMGGAAWLGLTIQNRTYKTDTTYTTWNPANPTNL